MTNDSEIGFDFSDYETKGRTAWIRIPGIREIELEVRPATTENAAWWAAAQRDLLAMAAEYKRENLSEDEERSAAVQERRTHAARNMERARIRDHLLVGWRGVKARGKAVEFSRAAVVELLAKLPDWAVKAIEDSASDRAKFFVVRPVTPEDAKVVAGNFEAG